MFLKKVNQLTKEKKEIIRIDTDKFRIRFTYIIIIAPQLAWRGDPLLKMVQFFFCQAKSCQDILSFPKGTYYNIKGKCTVQEI